MRATAHPFIHVTNWGQCMESQWLALIRVTVEAGLDHKIVTLQPDLHLLSFKKFKLYSIWNNDSWREILVDYYMYVVCMYVVILVCLYL